MACTCPINFKLKVYYPGQTRIVTTVIGETLAYGQCQYCLELEPVLVGPSKSPEEIARIRAWYDKELRPIGR